MTSRYSKETQEILRDFLMILGKHQEMDASLVAELRQMADEGTLDKPSQIKHAIARLEEGTLLPDGPS